MKHIIKSTNDFAFSVMPKSTDEEIIQNLMLILKSVPFEIPLDCGLGIAQKFRGKSVKAAEMLLYQDILDAVEQYEPRAEIESISFELDGITIIPILEVSTKE